MKAKTYKIIAVSAIAVILTVFLAVNIVCGIFSETITFWLCGYKTNTSSEDLLATREQGEKLAEQILGEGIVLLKNDGVLPLDGADTAVNVFGWSSTQWIGGGSGSGRVVSSDGKFTVETGLLEALDGAGIRYNTNLTGMYKRYLSNRPYLSEGTLNTYDYKFYRLYEPDIDDKSFYTDSLLDEAKSFSDTAIVVIGRMTGESSDAPTVQYKGVFQNSAPQDTQRTFLEISTEEEKLLTYAGANYDKVIVVVNSVSTMELGFLDTIPGLDSCILTGGTGINAATAIPKVLCGEITPSGRTTDTFAYDLSTNPSFANTGTAGQNYYTNGSGLYPNDGTKQGNVGGSNVYYDGVAYTDYAEGIYVGYKWYETADAEGYWDKVLSAHGNGYDGVVQFPFGYGLSYTDFDWEITALSPSANSALSKEGKINVTVRVTNTGETKGQDVVQLYFTPPYKPNQIEKASVTLGAFTKTHILEPGETEDVTLSLSLEDMASYDCYDKNANGFKGYELDAGDYQVKLMKNAHQPAKVVSGFQNAYNNAVIPYKVNQNIRYETDGVSGKTVSNKFTGADALDGVSADGSDSDAGIVYLSRSDFKNTFPSAPAAARAMTANVKALNLYTSAMANEWIKPSAAPVVTGAKNGMSVYHSRNGVTELGLALGADYYDSQWDETLDQLTITEMRDLVLHGYVKTKELNSIGKPLNMDFDGPAQIGSFNAANGAGTGFPTPTVLAQTFNRSLAYNFGLAVGKEAGNLAYDGWYGPGTNIHRSPLGGRNYEYYSEDAYLSGTMSAQTIRAAKNTGVYSYLKHLALYDQETNRDGLYTWLTEQSLREIYLKPFQLAVRTGGAAGIMTSYNRVGAVWAGGSYALLTGILRDEWDFKGTVITDYSDHHEFMNGDQMLRAGGDLWMDGYSNSGSFKFETSSNSFNQALRRASKNIIYTWLNALHANSVYNESEDVEAIVKGIKEPVFPWWIPILIGVDVLTAGGCAFWAYTLLRKKKAGEPKQA